MEEAYLPICSRCGKGLIVELKPVTLSCLHLYCFTCSQTVQSCVFDGTATTSAVDFSEKVEKLVKSRKSGHFQAEWEALKETINVNFVNCPRGVNCSIRSECPYSHPIKDRVIGNSQGWKCANCDVMVENDVCPFCREAGPVNTLITSSSRQTVLGWCGFMSILLIYYLIIAPFSAVLGVFCTDESRKRKR